MIAAGKCNVALISYGSTAHSDRRAIGTAGATGVGPATFINNMEDPWGLTLIGNYAMVKSRHMFQYGTTNDQFAHISVATRHHAMRNPEAVRAMTDLEFVGVRDLTVNDVLESRLIAYPLRLLECCMVSDGGGAVIIASAAVARNCLGFCKKGEGGQFVGDGHLVCDDPRKPTLNTDGGGLSSNHPGQRGIFLLLEATRQLRGESTSQVKDAKLAVAVGNGGQLGSRHATAVTILAAD